MKRDILLHPDPRLKKVCAPVADLSDELRRLAADLPVARLRRTDPRRVAARRNAARMSVRLHLAAYLTMVVIVLTVWLAVGLTAGAWYFWPIWPILGAGLGLAGHAVPLRLMGARHCAPRVGQVDGRPQWNAAGSPFAGC